MHIVKFVKNRSAAHFSIKRGDEKHDSDPALKEFISWDEKLQSFKKITDIKIYPIKFFQYTFGHYF